MHVNERGTCVGRTRQPAAPSAWPEGNELMADPLWPPSVAFAAAPPPPPPQLRPPPLSPPPLFSTLLYVLRGPTVVDWLKRKLQALVYDILPSTTAVFSDAIGSRKLSANEQFFVAAQTVVRLLQTTQIKQGVSFIAVNKVYTAQIKPQSFESRWNFFFSLFFFFTRGGCVSCLRACFSAK